MKTTLSGGVTCSANALTCSGNAAVQGDVLYGSGGTSLTTALATLSGYKSGDTFSAMTAFQTLYTASNFVAGTHGIITVVGSGGAIGMVACFFDGGQLPEFDADSVFGKWEPKPVERKQPTNRERRNADNLFAVGKPRRRNK